MPIERVEHGVPIDGREQFVDRFDYLEFSLKKCIEFRKFFISQWSYLVSILLSTAATDVQRTADEVILHVYHQECIGWPNNLFGEMRVSENRDLRSG